MRPVRIGEIARAIDLLWFYLVEQFHREPYILFAHRLLLDGARLVKRQVHEMDTFIPDPYIMTGGLRLATADQPLDAAYLGRIDIAGLFIGEELRGILQDLRAPLAVDTR